MKEETRRKWLVHEGRKRPDAVDGYLVSLIFAGAVLLFWVFG